MQTETVEHDGVKVVVSRASVLIGMRRTRLRIEGQQDTDAQQDIDHQILRQVLYPDLTAAVVSTDGLPWPLSFDEFLALPEQLVEPWQNAVYRLNPHWMPGGVPDEEQEKKEQTT